MTPKTDVSKPGEDGTRTSTALARDLTQGERELLESLSELDDLFFTVDDELVFTYANASFLRTVGLDRTELIGRGMTDLFPDMEGTHVLESYREALRTSESQAFEAYWPAVDTWFLVRASRSRRGLVVYGSPLESPRDDFRDAIKDSEERFRLLAQVTSDTVYDWKIEEDVLWWGGGFEALTGFERPHEPAGVDVWSRLLHEDDLERADSSLQEALGGDVDQWSCSYRIVREDGRVVDVHDRGYILRAADGRAIRMIGGMTDETERLKLDRHRLRAQRMEAMGKLTAGIAHDLNNILAPIIITASIMLEDLDADEDPSMVQDIEGMRAAADRGARMIRRLLAFTRGTGDEPRPLDLEKAVLEALRIVRETFPKSIELALHQPGELWLVDSDPTQIQQIVTNLAINSRDAIEGAGTITIRLDNVSFDAPPPDAIGDAGARRYVAMSVQDDGTGMDEETAAQAFEPFYTTKEVSEGTGLGLSSVLTIVENHEGFLRLESAVGQGTTVTVYFPTSKSDAVVARPRLRTPTPAMGDNELILVVDDESGVRDSAARALIRNGYHVLQARNVDSALALLERHSNVSLVLTDIMMPGRSGLELAEELQDRQGITLLGWTGLGTHPAAAEMRARGIRVLEKPLQMNDLLAAVSLALS